MLCKQKGFLKSAINASMFRVIVIFVLCSLCSSQEDSENIGEKETSTTESDFEMTRHEMVPGICEICSCTDGTVDCNDCNITTLFDNEHWEAIKDYNPTNLLFKNNPINKVNQLPRLPTKTLDLSHCDIHVIQNAAFINLTDLVTLDLSWNSISTSAINKMTFRGVFDREKGLQLFNDMRTLSLAHNDIHSLPQGIFTFMTTITSLDLSGNPLVVIDQVTMAAISELTVLKELKVSGCKLQSLPEGMFRRHRRLDYLDLSDNRFAEVPSVLKEAVNLVYLNFDKNPIGNLNETTAISELTKLRELRLCHLSKLEHIGAGILGGLHSLVTLYVCYNPRLTVIDPGFLVSADDHNVERYPNIKQLYLNNNNISEINSHFLDRWDQLTNMDFGNNNYICDCNCQWMVDVLVPLMNRSGISADSMICKKPRDLRGMSFAKLHELSKTLECRESEKLVEGPGPDVAMILGIMIGILATFPLVFVTVLLWRRGFFARCRGQRLPNKYYDEEENDAF